MREHAPHGTGDLFSALAFSALLDGGKDKDAAALARATAGVDQVLLAAASRTDLPVTALPSKIRPVKPWTVEPLTANPSVRPEPVVRRRIAFLAQLSKEKYE